eukprot:Tbor_TRINITY_DN3692_c0_g1::TRINITY_DN3692_c0_g1_i2::g.279::m.279
MNFSHQSPIVNSLHYHQRQSTDFENHLLWSNNSKEGETLTPNKNDNNRQHLTSSYHNSNDYSNDYRNETPNCPHLTPPTNLSLNAKIFFQPSTFEHTQKECVLYNGQSPYVYNDTSISVPLHPLTQTRKVTAKEDSAEVYRLKSLLSDALSREEALKAINMQQREEISRLHNLLTDANIRVMVGQAPKEDCISYYFDQMSI